MAMLLAGAPCVAASEPQDAAKDINLVVQVPSPDDGSAEQDAQLAEAERLLVAKEPERAIAALDPMIAAFEAKYADGKVRVFCGRTVAESMMYMVMAAGDHEKLAPGSSDDAIALGPQPAYAYFKKAYALIELGKVDQAKQALDKALALSPYNSNFLSEMGYFQQITKDWDAMLASYVEAETWAAVTSPDDQQKLDTARALRGQGYALIELNRLDDARARFKKSLKLDPGSAIAKGELEYIKTLDAKVH